MPASLPGDTDLNNGGNPDAGNFVIFDPLSGPKDAPLASADGNLSTGGLSTGIGYGTQVIDGAPSAAGFDDDQIPGTVQAQGFDGQAQNTFDSRMMYIGGGRSDADGTPNPYTAGIAICGAGQGGSRDTGANTGYALKMVTASGAVANGAAIEAGSINRSGVAMASGQSSFGSAAAGLAAAS